MISLVEALGYRCLRYVSQPLQSSHVLVGPNASGKTTFLDTIAFLSRLVADGLDAAVEERTQTFNDLVWNHGNAGFELAIEAVIPDDRRKLLAVPKYDTVRYEVALRVDPGTQETLIHAERGWLKVSKAAPDRQRALFPFPESAPKTLVTPTPAPYRGLFAKNSGNYDNFYTEAHHHTNENWQPGFKLGPRKSTLGNLPEDETNFPASSWFKQLLAGGVEKLVLNSLKIRLASPPGQGVGFRADGSNLPWVVAELEKSNPTRLAEWIAHLRMALPDLHSIRTVVRDDDRHRYLVLVYSGGLEVPSWMASDGTLRLLALTLPAYLDGLRGIYLIEEPENGIHPRAIETMYESLSSVYDAQILMATHSPVILSVAQADNVLCFAKNEEGATDVVVGSKHPRLADWNGQVDLGTLFASGVLS
jgi:predicted ATPase